MYQIFSILIHPQKTQLDVAKTAYENLKENTRLVYFIVIT